MFAPYSSQQMPATSSRGGTNCKQPDEDEVIYSLPDGYLTERRATNGVIAVNTDGSQCHDVNSEAREHGKEPC